MRALVCTMTHRGDLMPATRHGINRVDFSVLQRASYEEPVDMIFQGAFTAEHDDLNGVCQAIIVGQKVPAGTGTVSVQRDVCSERGAGAAGEPPPRFGLARNTLGSREVQQLDRHTRKRLREDVADEDAPRSFAANRQSFAPPKRAAAAWRVGEAPFASSGLAAPPEGVLAAPTPQTSRQYHAATAVTAAVVQHIVLSGLLVTTNTAGYFDAAAPGRLTPVPDAASCATRPCSPMWPSSPSMLM